MNPKMAKAKDLCVGVHGLPRIQDPVSQSKNKNPETMGLYKQTSFDKGITVSDNSIFTDLVTWG